ncbi:hypothetical protein Mapa_017364 [Marchantia paleacea]|nr:hypothetical protein Mapa_017364 [Marchantia paleacea]
MAPALGSWPVGRGVTARIAQEDPSTQFRAPPSTLAAATAARFELNAQNSLDGRRRPEEWKLPHHIHNRLRHDSRKQPFKSPRIPALDKIHLPSKRTKKSPVGCGFQDSTTIRYPPEFRPNQTCTLDATGRDGMGCDAVGG